MRKQLINIEYYKYHNLLVNKKINKILDSFKVLYAPIIIFYKYAHSWNTTAIEWDVISALGHFLISIV